MAADVTVQAENDDHDQDEENDQDQDEENVPYEVLDSYINSDDLVRVLDTPRIKSQLMDCHLDNTRDCHCHPTKLRSRCSTAGNYEDSSTSPKASRPHRGSTRHRLWLGPNRTGHAHPFLLFGPSTPIRSCLDHSQHRLGDIRPGLGDSRSWRYIKIDGVDSM